MSSTETKISKGRLCHIKKWDHFDGYGFNLHAEKGKPGQYIGKVDDNSPAEAAGLRQGDRIIEVNGEPISNKTHKQVVELIKSLPNETKLLVIDPHDDDGGGGGGSNGSTIISTESTNNHQKNSSEKHNNDVMIKKPSPPSENNTLNLSMTAAELRAKLASKKKFDPKKESMDFKQKFDIVQKL